MNHKYVVDGYHFYKNHVTQEVRVAKKYGKIWIVVKIFPFNELYSVKIWHGTLNSASKYWKTKPYKPNITTAKLLIEVFNEHFNTIRALINEI